MCDDCCPNGHDDFTIRLICGGCGEIHEVTVTHCGAEFYCHGRLWERAPDGDEAGKILA